MFGTHLFAVVATIVSAVLLRVAFDICQLSVQIAEGNGRFFDIGPEGTIQ